MKIIITTSDTRTADAILAVAVALNATGKIIPADIRFADQTAIYSRNKNYEWELVQIYFPTFFEQNEGAWEIINHSENLIAIAHEQDDVIPKFISD